MSNRHIAESKLDACDGPHLRASVTKLHTTYASLSGFCEKRDIVEAGTTIRGYLHAENVEWSHNGYVGLVTLTFAVNGGLVLVRFPRCNDFEWEDGTITDWETALYTVGHVPAGEMDRIAHEMERRIAAFPILNPLYKTPQAPEFFLGTL